MNYELDKFLLLVSELEKNKMFDSIWYLEQNPDVASSSKWSFTPCLHYLIIGGFEGRRPIGWFDSAWYLAEYPDVAKSGLNPLAHYFKHGRLEGRYPNLDHLNAMANYKSDIGRLALHLWGGLSAPALRELQHAYENTDLPASERWEACWQSSRWYYYTGDVNTAFSLGRLLQELDPSQVLRKEGVLLRAFCLADLGCYDEIRSELEDYIKANPNDSDGYFTMANTYLDKDEVRLGLINKALSLHGMVPIEKIDTNAPLIMKNITAQVLEKHYSNAKVSIIMPVYRAESHLHIAVNSLLNQSLHNVEIIIVDDCSPDGTFALAQKFAMQDSRIIALQLPQNSGAYAARNAGLKVASGDYITTHDSDDWSHPQKLATQIRYFEAHPNAMGVFIYWVRVRSNMQFMQNWRPNNALTHWSPSSFMFKRQVIDELGGWHEVRVGGDTEFIWRVEARYGQKACVKVQQHVPLAFALDEQGSLTRTKATHVKTIYFGLRHIYREICAWWHRTTPILHINRLQNHSSLSLPVAMQFRDGRITEVDVLLVSDFTDKTMSVPLLTLVEQASEIRIGVMHWPDFTKVPSTLIDEYFAFLVDKSGLPVVAGERLLTSHIVFAKETLLQYQVDNLPMLFGEAKCWLLNEGVVNNAPLRAFGTVVNPATQRKLVSILAMDY